MTALVTGASGFVGSAVVRALVRRGEPVRAMVRSSSRLHLLEGLPVEIVIGDLADPRTCEVALKDCRTVFHVAADYRLWVAEPATIYRTNVDGTRALLAAAGEAGVARIVHTSSVATLGSRPDRLPADETTPATLASMIGHYKRSKFLAEEAAREFARDGLPIVIVNPSAPVGPGDARPTPTGRVVLEAARGRMPAYVDTGLNIVHVDDVARGHVLAYEKGRIGERYILGGEDMRLVEILAEIASLYGRRPPRLRLPHAAVLPIAFLAQAWARASGGEPFATIDGIRMARKRMFFTSERARTELSYSPRPARDALRDAVAYFAARGLCPALPGPASTDRLSGRSTIRASGLEAGQPKTP